MSEPGPPRRQGLAGRELGLVFLLALVARVAAWLPLRDLPTFQVLVVDQARYERLARELLAHGWRPGGAFWQDPLYPYLLAAVHRLGGGLDAVRVLQVLVSAASAVVLAVAAERFAGRLAGLATGVLAALYAPALFWAPLVHKPTWSFAATAVLLAALAASPPERPDRRLVAAGLALGLAASFASLLFALVPVVLPWAAVRARRAAGAAAAGKALALLAFGLALPLAPAALVNLRHAGQPLGGNNSGTAFWIGNARGAGVLFRGVGAGAQDPDQMQRDARALATRVAGRPPASDAELSRILVRATLRDVAADPARWLALVGRRALLFWSALEVPEAESRAVHAEHAPILSLAPGWGVVVALGVPGLWVLARRRREAAVLLAALAAATCGAVALFFVWARFQFLAAPFLLVAAGTAIGALVRPQGATERRAVAVAGAVLLAAVAVPQLPAATRATLPNAARYELASAGLQLAGERLDAALASPDPVTRVDLLAEADRRLRESLAGFARVTTANPAFSAARAASAVAWFRLGSVWLAAGRPAEAAVAYERSAATARATLARPETATVPELVSQLQALLRPAAGNRALALEAAGRAALAGGRAAEGEAALAEAARVRRRLAGP